MCNAFKIQMTNYNVGIKMYNNIYRNAAPCAVCNYICENITIKQIFNINYVLCFKRNKRTCNFIVYTYNCYFTITHWKYNKKR